MCNVQFVGPYTLLAGFLEKEKSIRTFPHTRSEFGSKHLIIEPREERP